MSKVLCSVDSDFQCEFNCTSWIDFLPLSTLQAIMNFQRKSTIGFSIGNILLDLLGGVTNYGQMAMQSIDQSEFLYFNYKLLQI